MVGRGVPLAQTDGEIISTAEAIGAIVRSGASMISKGKTLIHWTIELAFVLEGEIEEGLNNRAITRDRLEVLYRGASL